MARSIRLRPPVSLVQMPGTRVSIGSPAFTALRLTLHSVSGLDQPALEGTLEDRLAQARGTGEGVFDFGFGVRDD